MAILGSKALKEFMESLAPKAMPESKALMAHRAYKAKLGVLGRKGK